MRQRRGTGKCLDYSEFRSPWTGLAAMILIQSISDLTSLGNADSRAMCGDLVTRKELEKFFKSRWAWHLATCCGLDEQEIRERGVLSWASG